MAIALVERSNDRSYRLAGRAAVADDTPNNVKEVLGRLFEKDCATLSIGGVDPCPSYLELPTDGDFTGFFVTILSPVLQGIPASVKF